MVWNISNQIYEVDVNSFYRRLRYLFELKFKNGKRKSGYDGKVLKLKIKFLNN